MSEKKQPATCPQCDYVFQGRRYEGIDGHWRKHHEHIMPYEEAWPLIDAGRYFKLEAYE